MVSKQTMPIGNSKWSTAKVKIALKTYELERREVVRRGEQGGRGVEKRKEGER
jgi:hypothetical protein